MWRPDGSSFLTPFNDTVFYNVVFLITDMSLLSVLWIELVAVASCTRVRS